MKIRGNGQRWNHREGQIPTTIFRAIEYIASNSDQIRLRDSEGNETWAVSSFNSLLAFLCPRKEKGEKNTQVTTQLRRLTDAIFKMIASEDKEIGRNEEDNELIKAKVGRWEVVSVKDKFLKFSYLNKAAWYIYNLSQFLNAGDRQEASTWPAEKMKEKALEIKAEIEKLGITTHKWFSPSFFAQHYILKKTRLPDSKKIPEGVKNLALESFRGGWIEAVRNGYSDRAYKYDLNSAYPSEIKKLYDLDRGQWKEANGEIPDRAYYGFVRVLANNQNQGFGKVFPIRYKTKKGTIVNPWFNGKTEVVLTLQELKTIQAEGWKIDIKGGWYWIPHPDEYKSRQPFAPVIAKLFQFRQETPFKDMVKLMMNGIYGKMIQRKRMGKYPGKLWNPVYASIITSNVALRVWEIAKRHQADILQIATDAIIVKKRLPLELGTKPGQWKLDVEGEFLGIGAGMYTIRNGTIHSKHMGLGMPLNFFEAVEKNREDQAIIVDDFIIYSIRQWLENGGGRKEDIGKLVKVLKNLVPRDGKRMWLWRKGTNIGVLREGLIESMPLSTHLL